MEAGKARVVRFGVFELDLASEELRKNGVRVKLTEQPFQVLVTLLERPGELIKRDELKQKLWADDTFVDFDHSLNAAINKLREALGDSAGNPRFVETVPRRGYRFIAPVEGTVGPGGDKDSEDAGSAATDANDASRAAGQSSRRQLRTVVTVLSILLLVAIGFSLAQWTRDPGSAPELPLRRFTIRPDNLVTAPHARPAISPNGKHIVYVVGDGNRTKLGVYDLVQDRSRELDGTDGGHAPFWSPGSDFIAFLADNDLKKIRVDGGPAITVAHMTRPFMPGGTWSPDGEYVLIGEQEMYKVPASGGDPIVVRAETTKEYGDIYPYLLPLEAGRVPLVFSRRMEDRIVLRDLTTGEQEALTTGAFPVYSASGHIVYQTRYVRDGLWALPVSLEILKATGEAFPIAQDATFPSVAADGTLAYVEQPQAMERQLVWRDRVGTRLGRISGPQWDLEGPSLSPDGRYILVAAEENSNRDIWLHDVVRSTKTRLTFHPALEGNAIWLPNGERVAFTSRRAGNTDIFTKPASGGGSARPLAATPRFETVNDWSPDGRTLIFQRNVPKTGSDLWYTKLPESEASNQAVPYLQTPAIEHHAKFSTDGSYVAYVSNETGRDEVYVRPFPKGDGQWQVSHEGGIQPRWSRDGKELFYVEGETLIAVSVSTEPTFEMGAATRLFSDPHLALNNRVRPQYDVSAHGQRFVMLETVGERPKPVIRVVQNWFAEFRDQ